MATYSTFSAVLTFPPRLLQKRIHWTTAFTSRLTAHVKLVGSTISCGRIHKHNKPELPFRSNPHVQSYMMATDQVQGHLLYWI